MDPIIEGSRYQTDSNRTAIIDNEHSSVTKEQPVAVRTSLLTKEWMDMFHRPASPTAQPPPHRTACSRRRNTLSNSLVFRDAAIIRPVEYTDPPNAPTPIPESAPAICREGIWEVLAGAWYNMALARTIHLPGWQLPSNHPPTLSGWEQERWAELGAVTGNRASALTTDPVH